MIEIHVNSEDMREWLANVIKVTPSAVLHVADNAINVAVANDSGSVVMSSQYTIDGNNDTIKMPIHDLRKLSKMMAMCKGDVVLGVDAAKITVTGGGRTIVMHMSDERVVAKTVNKATIDAINPPMVPISSSVIKDMAGLSKWDAMLPNLYIDTDGDSVYCTLANRSIRNTDSVRMTIADGITMDMTQPIIIPVDTINQLPYRNIDEMMIGVRAINRGSNVYQILVVTAENGGMKWKYIINSIIE